MQETHLLQTLNDQQEQFYKEEIILPREIDLKYYQNKKHIIAITGMRRSGKSTLLKLFGKQQKGCYVRFDDVRLSNIQIQDYQKIEEYALQHYKEPLTFYLDEIQDAPQWERWVNDLFTKGYKVFITGSNAKLLNSELSTQLTGRHIPIKLFTFSFKEKLQQKNISYNTIITKTKAHILTQLNEYLQQGGFPDIILTKDASLARQYYQDIITKDILLRYSFRNKKDVEQFGLYTISNASKIISYNKIRATIGIKSLETVKKYLDAFTESYILYQLSKYDHSIKKQLANPTKIYAGEIGFITQVGFAFSKNSGRVLENLAFLELKRREQEIYYHKKKHECDFVIKQGTTITQAIQVCYELTQENKQREIQGLIEACKEHKLQEGTILTHNQEETKKENNITIHIKPIWKWLLEN